MVRTPHTQWSHYVFEPLCWFCFQNTECKCIIIFVFKGNNNMVRKIYIKEIFNLAFFFTAEHAVAALEFVCVTCMDDLFGFFVSV